MQGVLRFEALSVGATAAASYLTCRRFRTFISNGELNHVSEFRRNKSKVSKLCRSEAYIPSFGTFLLICGDRASSLCDRDTMTPHVAAIWIHDTTWRLYGIRHCAQCCANNSSASLMNMYTQPPRRPFGRGHKSQPYSGLTSNGRGSQRAS